MSSVIGGVREVEAREFHSSFEVAANDPTSGPFLTPYAVDDFETMRCFLAEDGKVGGALKPTKDGIELVSLFNTGGPPGAGRQLARQLIYEGANRLDCIGEGLRRIYARLGFEVVDTLAWDDRHAPAAWDYDAYGRPRIYVMELRRGR